MRRHVVTLRAVAALAVALFAADGRPAFAQVELAGSWASLRTEDVSNDSVPVDYMGLPLNEEGRTKALAYSESQLSMIERQCQGWPAFYLMQGPFGLKIWSDTEPAKGTVVSYTIGAWEDRAPMVIYMDGRPHPSATVQHTRAGFTTGRWDGATLVARTTHMQAGVIRKNGAPSSDRVTMTTHFIRHGGWLTLLMVIEDPVYLAEPQVMTRTFELTATELSPVGPPCISTFEGRDASDGVPHYLPEANPFVDELTRKFGVPRDAVLGVPETLYPEYRRTMRRPVATRESRVESP